MWKHVQEVALPAEQTPLGALLAGPAEAKDIRTINSQLEWLRFYMDWQTDQHSGSDLLRNINIKLRDQSIVAARKLPSGGVMVGFEDQQKRDLWAMGRTSHGAHLLPVMALLITEAINGNCSRAISRAGSYAPRPPRNM